MAVRRTTRVEGTGLHFIPHRIRARRIGHVACAQVSFAAYDPESPRPAEIDTQNLGETTAHTGYTSPPAERPTPTTSMPKGSLGALAFGARVSSERIETRAKRAAGTPKKQGKQPGQDMVRTMTRYVSQFHSQRRKDPRGSAQVCHPPTPAAAARPGHGFVCLWGAGQRSASLSCVPVFSFFAAEGWLRIAAKG